ncbi:uncharacterized protein LOC144302962 isoform X2 [Canis aureus]
MISVGLLDYMVTTFTCGRVSRECQDLPPGDLLSHQELLWKLCQTDPKVRYIIEKVCWEATKDYFDMCCCLHRGYLSSCPVFSDPCGEGLSQLLKENRPRIRKCPLGFRKLANSFSRL